MNPSGPDFASRPLGAFLDDLASKRPVPGGGAAAGTTVATAAALASMVVAYSLGRKNLLEHREELKTISSRLEHLRGAALAAADADAVAYEGLQALWSLDKTDPKRVEHWSSAVEAAIAAPRAIMEFAEAVLEIAERLEGRSNRMLRSDLAIAAVLADAGHRGAAANVLINLPLLDDPARAASETATLSDAIERFRRRAERLERACR